MRIQPARRISKNEFERELHDSGIPRKIGDLSELPAGDVIIRYAEMRIVEGIQHVPTQLHLSSFAEIIERPCHVEIELCQSGTCHGVSPQLPSRAGFEGAAKSVVLKHFVTDCCLEGSAAGASQSPYLVTSPRRFPSDALLVLATIVS